MSEKEQKIDLPIYCCYCGPHQRLKDNTFFDNRLQCSVFKPQMNYT